MFEAFSQKQRVKHGRWVVVSTAVHLLLLVLVMRAMVARHSSIEKQQQVRLTYYSPPPPPPPPASGSKRQHKTEPKIKKPDLVQQPIVHPEIAQPKEEEKPEEKEEKEEEAGDVGGVAGGVAGGVVGGVVGGTGTRAEFGGRMTPPRLIAGPAIEYTEKALENDVEGLMIVRCVLTVEGQVKECQVKQNVRFMDNAVVETLQRRRYTPVTLEARPIEVYYTFRIRLTLPR